VPNNVIGEIPESADNRAVRVRGDFALLVIALIPGSLLSIGHGVEGWAAFLGVMALAGAAAGLLGRRFPELMHGKGRRPPRRSEQKRRLSAFSGAPA
jgi:hypothetical protein